MHGKVPCVRGMLLNIYSGCTVVLKHAIVWAAVILKSTFCGKETMYLLLFNKRDHNN